MWNSLEFVFQSRCSRVGEVEDAVGLWRVTGWRRREAGNEESQPGEWNHKVYCCKIYPLKRNAGKQKI